VIQTARFIAEVGSNHNRELERAAALVDAYASAGANAIKIQVFQIDDLFAPSVLEARGDLRARRATEFPLELLAPLEERCRERSLQLGATPFSLCVIERLLAHIDFLKIASYELLWHDLIRECAGTGKPLIVSTGMATDEEIDAAVSVAREAGCNELSLLHCVSGYPTPPAQCNLMAIATLRERHGCPVGWSDHSVDVDVVSRAVRRWGASDVEMHVDLEQGGGLEGGEHNWTPSAMHRAIHVADGAALKDAALADGDGVKRPMPVEVPDVAWRADPRDGLRPLQPTRAALRAH
jgi:N-acetylneuraminate synthase